MSTESSADEIAVNLGDATPRRLLVDWANNQDAWVRQLTAESILSRQEPGEDTLEKVYATFLAEKGLSGQPLPTVPTLELDAVEPSQDDTLELSRLYEVEHVNALAPEQTPEFDADLTVLFGQNGSGKTGYARILKRISAVRRPEDILPNAHAPAASAATPSARIEYRLSGHAKAVHWKNEAGLSPFTRISVFDSAAVSLHVDSDLGYVYTPRRARPVFPRRGRHPRHPAADRDRGHRTEARCQPSAVPVRSRNHDLSDD
ncbi:ATP-binding protein [Nocardioides sp. B-3]|uniref:ATP-binding protein n=1 Tax=Nocardioides sp. B-3 TaxID=2895565 RepID=UPI0021537CE2|nr:ATP-binding protein [Nocardioides sp. B-3]UUZ58570.1 ATP-binding protein [Nocardioides sp. B-3]